MPKLGGQIILMAIVTLVITGFQGYWLRDNYRREKQALEVRTQALFESTARDVQDSVLEAKWKMLILRDSLGKKQEKSFTRPLTRRRMPEPIRLISRLGQRMAADSMNGRSKTSGVFITVNDDNQPIGDSNKKIRVVLDSLPPHRVNEMVIINTAQGKRVDTLTGHPSGNERMLRIAGPTTRDSVHRSYEINTVIFDNERGDRFKVQIDSLISDSIPLNTLKDAYAKVLQRENLDIPFSIHYVKMNSIPGGEFIRGPLTIEDSRYKLTLGNTFPHLLQQITSPLLFSIFLIGLTIAVFVVLYRSLLRQQRVAVMKNELISNITHELKTPIATVGVAIEALKNFNAIQDPERTKEYLDISQHELQRLGLLVDKVLKLSMFERKAIELKYETFDLAEAVQEVLNSLRLQIEKYNARVTFRTEGDTTLHADRLHIVSVVFNLVDNALKYSKVDAAIQIDINEVENNVCMKVTDNGIGIPAAYKERIFEKFFRVPAGDTHNAKGHGLGLSYAAQVLKQHKGSIVVESQEGIGSAFTILLPKNQDSSSAKA